MSESRIVVETPCEHGEQNPHPYPGKRISDLPYCPGGAREVVSVPSPEAIEAAAEVMERMAQADEAEVMSWREMVQAGVNAFIRVQFGIENPS